MRKTKLRIITTALSAIFAVSCLFGCGSATVEPKNTVGTSTEHYWEGGLHKVSVTENASRVFAKNGVSEYSVVYEGSSSKALYAANFLRKHINSATGASVSVTAGEEITSVTESDKYIVVGRRDLFTSAGFSMPNEDLAPTGYYIKTFGNSVFIEVVGEFGYQQAAIQFLKHVLGYTMYSEDTVVYARSGETIPDMDIIEKPDYGYRVQGNNVSDEARYGMGFINNQDIIIPVGQGGYFHNSLQYFDSTETVISNKYFGDHPNWLATSGKELCYTARGDEAELELMITHVANRIITLAKEYKDVPVITFTIQDNYFPCECEECKSYEKTYGSAAAAARYIRFTNRVADKVDAYFTEEAANNGGEKREILITIFGYHNTTQPPVKQNADGSYSAIDESVVLRKNVGVFVAPIEASFTHSFYDDVNAQYAGIVRGWGAISSHVYAWVYEPNYSYYMYPFNTFDSSLETLRFFRENNAEYVWTEGQTMQYNATGFNKLKEYINSVEEFDVNCNLKEITDDFFEKYFCEAAEPMRQFLSEFQMWSRGIENDETNPIRGTIYEEIANVSYWPKKLLDHWLDLVDEAYEAISPLKYTNAEKYEVLAKHIKIESIFPRYALLTLYAGYYNEAELTAERKAFRDDCYELNIQYSAQNVSLDLLFDSWGV